MLPPSLSVNSVARRLTTSPVCGVCKTISTVRKRSDPTPARCNCCPQSPGKTRTTSAINSLFLVNVPRSVSAKPSLLEHRPSAGKTANFLATAGPSPEAGVCQWNVVIGRSPAVVDDVSQGSCPRAPPASTTSKCALAGKSSGNAYSPRNNKRGERQAFDQNQASASVESITHKVEAHRGVIMLAPWTVHRPLYAWRCSTASRVALPLPPSSLSAAMRRRTLRPCTSAPSCCCSAMSRLALASVGNNVLPPTLTPEYVLDAVWNTGPGERSTIATSGTIK
eukprot:2683351-Amphidinium_carterae.3